MILLKGHSLEISKPVPLENMSLTLKEKESSASITPADMDGIGIDSWLLDNTNPGKGIVWRVKSISTAYATNTPTVQLEHAISTLKDRILFGEHNAAKITEDKKAKNCTAKQAIQYVLKQQSDWVLGTCSISASNPYKFDGDSLFDAIQKVTDSVEGAWWSYDFSVYPFRLNIGKKQDDTVCELRPGRNLTKITKSIDKSGMYTRFYPIGKNDLHISGNYVSRNEKTYGIVSHVETDQSLDTEAELRRWAEERLRKHAEPYVTISADGLELADATGESLDRLRLGRVCRVPLHEFGTVIEERITEIRYNDKINQPEVVRITMANEREDVTKILSNVIKRGGHSARTSTKKDKEDNAWMEDTNDHVALCAKGIIGVDAKGEPNWVRLSDFVVDDKGVHSKVRTLVDGVEKHESQIEQDESKIALVVDGQNVIKAASIVAAINESGDSSIVLDADHVDLHGYVTADSLTTDWLNAKIGQISIVKGVTARWDGYLSAPNIYIGVTASAGSIPSSANLKNAIRALQISNGNLYYKDYNNDNWQLVGSLQTT